MTKKIIIGLVGLPHSGRRVVGARLVNRFGFTPVDFGDAIDRMLEVLGADKESLHGQKQRDPVPDLGGRSFQYAKQALGYHFGRRMISENVWIGPWRRRVAQTTGNMVVSDIRFPNEAEAVREAGGLIIRVDRPGRPALNNATSRILTQIRVDGVFINTGRDITELVALVDKELAEVFGLPDAAAA